MHIQLAYITITLAGALLDFLLQMHRKYSFAFAKAVGAHE